MERRSASSATSLRDVVAGALPAEVEADVEAEVDDEADAAVVADVAGVRAEATGGMVERVGEPTGDSGEGSASATCGSGEETAAGDAPEAPDLGSLRAESVWGFCTKSGFL